MKTEQKITKHQAVTKQLYSWQRLHHRPSFSNSLMLCKHLRFLRCLGVDLHIRITTPTNCKAQVVFRSHCCWAICQLASLRSAWYQIPSSSSLQLTRIIVNRSWLIRVRSMNWVNWVRSMQCRFITPKLVNRLTLSWGGNSVWMKYSWISSRWRGFKVSVQGYRCKIWMLEKVSRRSSRRR